MKFEIIDGHGHGHGHGHERESSSTTHKYLDELLDSTFITDYFLDKSSKDTRADATAEPLSK